VKATRLIPALTWNLLHISLDWYSKMLKDLLNLEESIQSEVISDTETVAVSLNF
jgi:hypothetical protein